MTAEAKRTLANTYDRRISPLLYSLAVHLTYAKASTQKQGVLGVPESDAAVLCRNSLPALP
jgi:hypothetical protein